MGGARKSNVAEFGAFAGKQRIEFWKQITLGAGGTGLLGAADVVDVVTVAGG
jgi:hypothetical protein